MVRRVVRPQTVLLVASAGVFMEFVDSTIVNIAFPSIRSTFPNAALSELSWVFNAYSIVFAAFLVAAGRLSDLLGRKRLFEIGIAVFTLGSAACAVAPSVNLLIAARALQAFGGAIVVPASLALVLHAYPAHERAGAVGVWGATAALAAALGPPLGGVLVGLSNWRLAFLVNVPVGVLALIAGRRTLVESRAPGRRTVPDLLGALLLAVSISTLVLGIVKGQEWGWTGPRILGSFAVAVISAAVFAWRSTWHRSPLLDLDLLRIRSFSVANLATIVASVGFYAYLLCHVLFLTSVWHYSAVRAGLSLVPSALVASITARTAGKIADRHGFQAIVIPGALIWTGALVYYTQRIGLHPHFISRWLPGQLIQGLGVGLVFPQLGGAALSAVPETRYATAGAVTSSARQLGAALGIAILIIIVGTPSPADALDAFRHGWAFAAGCFALVTVLALALGARRGAEPAGASAEDVSGPRAELHLEARPAPAEAADATAEAPGSDELAAVSLFAGLDTPARAALAEGAPRVDLPAGEWLFRAGDPGDGLYIVRSGRLEVVIEDPDRPVARVLTRGAVLGELALLTDSPRSASVRARRDSELAFIGRDRFLEALGQTPAFARSVMRTLGGELQRSRGVAEETQGTAPATIAVVAAHAGTAAREVCDALSHELGRVGRVALLDGPGDASEASLDRLERDHDHVLLLVEDPGASDPWTGWCLRQADRIVALVAGQPLSAWAQREPLLQGCDLLLDETAPGERVDAHLGALGPRSTYRVRAGADRDGDLAVVARRLAGRSIGVVLSGGGARALAHVGALEELRAGGVTIDRFGGASTGAVIAAMFAIGMDPEEIDARCYEEFVRRSPLNDYTVPRASLIRGAALRRMLERTFGDARIETLPRSFYCVSADLMTGERVTHRSGSLVDALRAGMSIPGLMPPVASGERRLVDGGVLDNLPVQDMARTHEGPVIAVDVSARRHPPTLMAPSGRSRGPAAGALPSVRETLSRAMLLGSSDTAEAAREHAQLVILPEDRGVGFLEFHQYDTLRDAGRRAARAALELPGAAALLRGRR